MGRRLRIPQRAAALLLAVVTDALAQTLPSAPPPVESPALPAVSGAVPALPAVSGAVPALPAVSGAVPAVAAVPATSGAARAILAVPAASATAPVVPSLSATGAAPATVAGQHPEWLHVPASDPNLDFYLDRNSIAERDGEVEFWDVVIFHQPSQRDEASGRMIKEKRTLRRISCRFQDQMLLKGASFDEAGRLIEAVTLNPQQSLRNPVRSGTIAGSELYRVCLILGQDVPLEPLARAAGMPSP